ncbi:MAG TPA: phage baseplate assembly protein V [Sphingopyxis sp.]|nr:phage baseplate assembly protein V [Sphingopyxis sp.]
MAAAREDIPFDPSALIRFGVVASVDLDAGRVVMALGDPDEEELTTPPLRWFAWRAGATRSWSPPTEGEQGMILCPEGELALGIVLFGINSDDFPAPGSTIEELVEFADGARIAYDPESHTLTAALPGGSTVDVTADQVNITGDAAIAGNVAITGDLTVTGTITADTDVIGGGKSLKNHKHTAVTAGGGVSGPPQ